MKKDKWASTWMHMRQEKKRAKTSRVKAAFPNWEIKKKQIMFHVQKWKMKNEKLARMFSASSFCAVRVWIHRLSRGFFKKKTKKKEQLLFLGPTIFLFFFFFPLYKPILPLLVLLFILSLSALTVVINKHR